VHLKSGSFKGSCGIYYAQKISMPNNQNSVNSFGLVIEQLNKYTSANSGPISENDNKRDVLQNATKNPETKLSTESPGIKFSSKYHIKLQHNLNIRATKCNKRWNNITAIRSLLWAAGKCKNSQAFLF